MQLVEAAKMMSLARRRGDMAAFWRAVGKIETAATEIDATIYTEAAEVENPPRITYQCACGIVTTLTLRHPLQPGQEIGCLSCGARMQLAPIE